MTSAKGVPIQNDGKQDVFQQLQGWIHAGFEAEYPWRVTCWTFTKSVSSTCSDKPALLMMLNRNR